MPNRFTRTPLECNGRLTGRLACMPDPVEPCTLPDGHIITDGTHEAWLSDDQLAALRRLPRDVVAGALWGEDTPSDAGGGSVMSDPRPGARAPSPTPSG